MPVKKRSHQPTPSTQNEIVAPEVVRLYKPQAYKHRQYKTHKVPEFKGRDQIRW